MRFLVLACVFVALAGCHKSAEKTPTANQSESAPDTTGIKGVHREHKGKAAPDTTFKDADGNDISLAEFRGKRVLVNLWASWCAPCVKELPTLARLSRANPGLEIAAVSQDNGPHASVAAFLNSHQAGDLEAFQDAPMALSGGLGVEVMPTSVLYDAQGREVWRYVGDLDWTSSEAAKLLAEGGVGSAR